MNKYSHIIFDLFDTLILFKPELLPNIEINGSVHHSTGKDVYSEFSKKFDVYGFEEFYKYFAVSYKEFQKLKNLDNREYPNSKRFEIMLNLMEISIDDPEFLGNLVESHMNSLSKSMVFPKGNLDVVSELRNRGYHLSILSNFDYSPTAHKLLELYNITTYIHDIFISDKIGWRKPSSKAFEFVLKSLNISPSEAVFIGDDYNRDILGADKSKIDSIYLNSKEIDGPYSPAIEKISEFHQLLEILE